MTNIISDEPSVPLNIPLKTLAFIVAKAREYEAETAPVDEDSGSNPTDDASRDVLEASVDNPTRQELLDALNGLNVDERVDVLAMTWLGRGDYEAAEWEEAREQARERMNKREAEYLVSTPLLADFIEDALDLLGYSEEDLEEASGEIDDERAQH